MDQIKSFEGDLVLVRHLAYSTLQPPSPAPLSPSVPRPQDMPLFHCLDQHVKPIIAYMIPYSLANDPATRCVPLVLIVHEHLTLTLTLTPSQQGFEPLMKRLFKEVTGINYRKLSGGQWDAFTKSDFVQSVHASQRLLYLTYLRSTPSLPISEARREALQVGCVCG
jgi:hypothetical protein